MDQTARPVTQLRTQRANKTLYLYGEAFVFVVSPCRVSLSIPGLESFSMSDHFSMLHPHFTPDITLGHLVQAVVVIATVGGGVLGGYLSLRSDLETQRAEFRVALAGHEARLVVAERLIEERRTEDRQFEADMRAALERVMQAIADLRTSLVRKQDRK
jgi:hypothetical protein